MTIVIADDGREKDDSGWCMVGVSANEPGFETQQNTFCESVYVSAVWKFQAAESKEAK